METQDLDQLSGVAASLWAEPRQATRTLTESLTLASAVEESPGPLLEKTAQALLMRAGREGAAIGAHAIRLPFFRLAPPQRMLLTALHRYRWSYARLARILGLPVEDVARRAWDARLQLPAMPGSGVNVGHPTGSRIEGGSCPDYDARAPWTQRFLDDELQARERVFLQAHVLKCSACQESLKRCRALYFAVESILPEILQSPEAIASLEQVMAQSRTFHRPSRMSAWQALEVFADRRDTRIAVGLLAALLIIALRR